MDFLLDKETDLLMFQVVSLGVSSDDFDVRRVDITSGAQCGPWSGELEIPSNQDYGTDAFKWYSKTERAGRSGVSALPDPREYQ
jgi:hypothetical protein